MDVFITSKYKDCTSKWLSGMGIVCDTHTSMQCPSNLYWGLQDDTCRNGLFLIIRICKLYSSHLFPSGSDQDDIHMNRFFYFNHLEASKMASARVKCALPIWKRPRWYSHMYVVFFQFAWKRPRWHYHVQDVFFSSGNVQDDIRMCML